MKNIWRLKKHIGRRNIHKILKWINLLIKEMVEKSLPSKWIRLFLFHLLEKSVASFTTKTNMGSFSFPLTVTYLQCCSCPPRHSGIQRWANAVLRKSQSGTDPSGSSSLVDVGPQGLVQSLKVGPVGYVTTPTTHHQLEERRWTQWRSVKENLDRENSHQKHRWQHFQ